MGLSELIEIGIDNINMTAEEVAAPAETRKEEVNKSDKNMFDRVKERFSKRNKKKIEDGDEKKETDNMTEINLTEKELLEKDSDEKKITEDKNTIEKKPEKKIIGIEKVKEQTIYISVLEF